MWKRLKIGAKLILFGTVAVSVPIAAVAAFSISRSANAIFSMTRDQLSNRAREYAALVDTAIDAELRSAMATAASPEIVDAALTIAETGYDKTGE
jgi:hypothetical protein